MSLTLTITDKADGTGATATIVGGIASGFGRSNVYVRSLAGNGPWSSGGTRTGDGTLNLALAPGSYVAYVAEEQLVNALAVTLTSGVEPFPTVGTYIVTDVDISDSNRIGYYCAATNARIFWDAAFATIWALAPLPIGQGSNFYGDSNFASLTGAGAYSLNTCHVLATVTTAYNQVAGSSPVAFNVTTQPAPTPVKVTLGSDPGQAARIKLIAYTSAIIGPFSLAFEDIAGNPASLAGQSLALVVYGPAGARTVLTELTTVGGQIVITGAGNNTLVITGASPLAANVDGAYLCSLVDLTDHEVLAEGTFTIRYSPAG